jgi:hypothetical protein
VLERLRELRKTPWTFIKDNTEPIALSGDVLVLGVRSARLRDTLASRDDYTAYLQQAIREVLGRSLRVDAVVQPGGSGTPRTSSGSAARGSGGGAAPAATAPPPATPQPAEADPTDDVLDDVSGADLLTRELGASVIDVVDQT